MKTRLMPLALERPSFDDLRDDLWTLTGRRPTAADIFDRVEVNPRRGGWDLYTKVWPVLVGLLIVAVIVFPRQAGALVGNPEAQNGRAHTCWLSSTEFDALAGCRMNDGTLVGHTTKVTTTCFFDEPMDETKDTVPCH